MEISENKIRIYGTIWCPDCRRARDVFKSLKVDYEWINTDCDREARRFVMETNHGNCSVPTIVFADGSIMVEPSSASLESKLHSLN